MNDLFFADDASTPLTEDEKKGLIPSFISFRHELNALEEKNILKAEQWLMQTATTHLLSEKFLKHLHKKMFEDVWSWAGSFRKTERNIGVEAYQIPMELKKLIDDVTFWIENNTFKADEIAVRFHHRLVLIHPFSNGNGRHSRLATDLLLRHLQCERFSWGSKNLINANETRRQYIAALRNADQYDLQPLLAFVRS